MQIKDSSGQTHYLAQAPKRIISCMPSITEMLFALGLNHEIKGVTLNCNYPPAARRKAKVGREIINIEKVTSLHPHLVVMLEDAQKVDIQKLRKFGLPVFTINPHSIAGVRADLLLLGIATSREAEALVLVGAMDERLKSIEEKMQRFKLKKKKILVVVGLKPLIVAGPKTFIADILKTAGVDNLASDAKGDYPLYSMEKLIASPPDVIIIPQSLVKKPNEIYNDPKWKQIPAVKQERVLFIDQDIISRPGPRVVEAVEQIAKFVYNF